MLTNKQSLRVCVYNYKGDAAKTTIVVNTAAALAHPKHGNQKVLLIDLDPQCNSTQFYHDDNETLGGARTLGKNETEPTSACAAAEALTQPALAAVAAAAIALAAAIADDDAAQPTVQPADRRRPWFLFISLVLSL